MAGPFCGMCRGVEHLLSEPPRRIQGEQQGPMSRGRPEAAAERSEDRVRTAAQPAALDSGPCEPCVGQEVALTADAPRTGRHPDARSPHAAARRLMALRPSAQQTHGPRCHPMPRHARPGQVLRGPRATSKTDLSGLRGRPLPRRPIARAKRAVRQQKQEKRGRSPTVTAARARQRTASGCPPRSRGPAPGCPPSPTPCAASA